jgi:hypothetical protein
MEQHYKYKKTFHLTFSPGLKNDDRRIEDEHCFDGKDIVVSIKMDGENTTMYRDSIHARSLYQMKHPSQHWVKAYHGQIKHLIPEGWRICGENLYAEHSIRYDDLEHFFQIFSIWNEKNECLSYPETEYFCRKNKLTHVYVPVWIENFTWAKHGEALEEWFNIYVGLGQEGIVIRNMHTFKYEDFQENVAKAVRKNHVQTDVHWTKTWKPNKLRT